MTTANTAQATSRPHSGDDMRRLHEGLCIIQSAAHAAMPGSGEHFHRFRDIEVLAGQLRVLVPAIGKSFAESWGRFVSHAEQLKNMKGEPYPPRLLDPVSRIRQEAAAFVNGRVPEQTGKTEMQYAGAYPATKDDTRLLGNLLAVIHGDGGHYQHRVGTAQAVADAGQIFHSLAVTAGLGSIPTALPDDTDGHGLTRRSADGTLMVIAESVAVRLGRINLGRLDRGTIEAVVLGALKDWETSLLPRPIAKPSDPMGAKQ